MAAAAARAAGPMLCMSLETSSSGAASSGAVSSATEPLEPVVEWIESSIAQVSHACCLDLRSVSSPAAGGAPLAAASEGGGGGGVGRLGGKERVRWVDGRERAEAEDEADSLRGRGWAQERVLRVTGDESTAVAGPNRAAAPTRPAAAAAGPAAAAGGGESAAPSPPPASSMARSLSSAAAISSFSAACVA